MLRGFLSSKIPWNILQYQFPAEENRGVLAKYIDSFEHTLFRKKFRKASQRMEMEFWHDIDILMTEYATTWLLTFFKDNKKTWKLW